MGRLRTRFLMTSLLGLAIVILGGASSDSDIPRHYPAEDAGADSLAARKKAQLETVNRFKVFYQFHFTDKLKESGITFVYHAVDDITKHMKMGHYDHGSAIAVADVDGDGLYDIYFVNQVGGNELWKNLGGGKFKNITQEAGVGLPDRINVGAAFADVNNDGSEDLFVTTVRGGNVLFKNDGHGHFTDISKEAGVDLVAHSSGASSSTTTTMACSIFSFATSGSTPRMKKVRMANMRPYQMHFRATYIPIAMNIPFSTRIWATTTSKMLPPRWDCDRTGGAATPVSAM
ncbi:MAG TPA: VCBS repeat-containing protein [Terriglobales bacterium]|nr:VCBS repeat-containing protein [Terriglobales bacterium]